MVDGSMPYTHIAEVQAVSFTGPEMRIRLISVSPPVELPIYYLADGGSNGDTLISRELVEAYYHPAVPRQPFPPDYDPAVDPYPQILTEYISARYFQPGEKVIVVQDGQDFFVMSKIFPDEFNTIVGIGAEVEHENWLSMMDGSTFIPDDSLSVARVLLSDDTLCSMQREGIPYTEMFYQNYNLAYTMLRNSRFPIHVFPREPLVHLSNVNWSWAGGAYNYAYFDKIDDSLYQKLYSEYERFWSPTVVFPGRAPDVRLEVQSATPPGTDWLDELPDIEFYATSSGMNLNTSFHDFVNNDDHVELVLSISRPWGIVTSNANEWKTSNWVPPILFCPDDSLANPPGATDLPKPAVSFGFVDYKKVAYTGDRSEITNEYRFVTGKIFAELKTGSIGKPLLGKNDYNYTETHTVEVKDSGYSLHILETVTDLGGGEFAYDQRATMNQAGETEQLFTVCTDGINFLKKKPILNYSDYRVPGPLGGTSTSIELSIEHYINNTLMFTSTFNTTEDRATWNQRLYYIYSVDIINKLILAHVYVYDEPGVVQQVEGVVIDNGTEYIVWTFDRSQDFDDLSEQVNVPPWLGSTTFPDHHVGGDPANYPAEQDITEYLWKVPYFDNIFFPLNGSTTGDCAFAGEPPGGIGVYFPCTEFDEDIRSILLLNTIHYDPSTSVQGYTQRKQHNVIKPRRNGWVAFMRCCFSSFDGTISYTYGSDIIIKKDGVVSDGSYLLGTPDEELNTYEV